ncbi:hypothetical protein CDAR_394161 [Caerostris darwini]|uniref:Ycf15 n=1 Tax=Caerostris darwini TaxID=1538125 RepID=A0AAV4RJ44_9ARAC|nr:hypothetical protein CDAR_394161 [Caerostris darwini]
MRNEWFQKQSEIKKELVDIYSYPSFSLGKYTSAIQKPTKDHRTNKKKMIRSDPFRISPDLGVHRDRLMSSCHHANACIVMNFSGQARDSVIQNRG